MAISYQEIFAQLQTIGVIDVLVPFILFFALSFAILEKVGIFLPKLDGLDAAKQASAKSESKRYNAMIAFVIAAFVVVPHVTGMYPAGTDIVEIVNHALPNVSLIMVAFLTLFILIGLWGGSPKWEDKPGPGWVVLFCFIAVGFIFARAAHFLESWPSWLNWLDDSSTMTLVVIVLAFIIIISFITGGEPKDAAQLKREEEASFRKSMRDLFG